MFKFLIAAVISSLVCAAYAANPQDAHAYTLRYDNDIDPEGNYKYLYETSNGISAQEQGSGGHYASGGYAYYSPEGQLVQLSYVADENGFQPTGSHLPTPPPIPHAILRSLEYIRTHPQYQEPRVYPQRQYFQRRHQ